MTSSVTCELFRSMFNFQIFPDFPGIFLLLIPLLPQNAIYMYVCYIISVLLNFFKFVLWPEMCMSFFFFFNLFIYLWLYWVLVAVHGLSLVVASGGYSSLLCTGFSSPWLLLLQSTWSRRVGSSSCGSRAVERRLSSCDAWA